MKVCCICTRKIDPEWKSTPYGGLDAHMDCFAAHMTGSTLKPQAIAVVAPAGLFGKIVHAIRKFIPKL